MLVRALQANWSAVISTPARLRQCFIDLGVTGFYANQFCDRSKSGGNDDWSTFLVNHFVGSKR
jgi:hypothetical protein